MFQLYKVFVLSLAVIPFHLFLFFFIQIYVEFWYCFISLYISYSSRQPHTFCFQDNSIISTFNVYEPAGSLPVKWYLLNKNCLETFAAALDGRTNKAEPK